ncbi:MAG: hypothetical protein HY316_06850 [Acidobacteria bacterium]|nr:hypothetical protein [Acidobacteriota bacterium]
MLGKRIVVGAGLVAVLALVIALVGALSRVEGQQTSGLLLIQQDKVIRFNTVTGEGVQTGTATGRINGVSIVNFKFSEAASGLPDITFDNRAGITDLDGDQIIFHNTGIGKFVVPPLIDETAVLTNQVFGATPLPCPGFGGSCSGVGGPLIGTYEVVATSGKYVSLYPIGRKFPYRGIAYNPSSPPGDPNDFGNVYVEVQATPLP